MYLLMKMHFSLYDIMYNINIYLYIIYSYITTNIKMYFSLYNTMYKNNIYLLLYNNKHFFIHENVYRLIRDNV